MVLRIMSALGHKHFERKQKDRLAAVSPKNSITLTSLSSAAY